MIWDHSAISEAAEHPLKNKKIILGITGSIAAYKGAELVRLLIETGAEVQVVMTEGGKSFVQPLTFQALSGRSVRSSLWDEGAEAAMGHIELARWADLVLIAPATANIIAKLAQGISDDLLTTLCMASNSQLMVAPAMNQAMWHNPATESNIMLLKSRGYIIAGPSAGDQACGDVGMGRMSEPAHIVSVVKQALAKRLVSGLRCLITAGPTREPLDPIRYLSNYSSGVMGFALAAAAADAGFETSLVCGPVSLPGPYGVNCTRVESAIEMKESVFQEMEKGVDLFIGSAAVCDYRSHSKSDQKIKKTGQKLDLQLVQNPDIISEIANAFPNSCIVGFAAETENLIKHASAKLNKKSLDVVIANDVSVPGIGMNQDKNKVTIILRSDRELRATLTLGPLRKDVLARQIMAALGCYLSSVIRN